MLPTKTWAQGAIGRKSACCVIPKDALNKFGYKPGDELYIDWEIVIAMSKAHQQGKNPYL